MRTVLLLFLISFIPRAIATNLEACGSIASISGEKCEDLKVSFNLEGCGEIRISVPAKINCTPSEAVATFHGNKKNYRAVLVKSGNDSGWAKKHLTS